MIRVSELMIIRWSYNILSIHKCEIGKLITHSHAYHLKDNWDNILDLEHMFHIVWGSNFYDKLDHFRSLTNCKRIGFMCGYGALCIILRDLYCWVPNSNKWLDECKKIFYYHILKLWTCSAWNDNTPNSNKWLNECKNIWFLCFEIVNIFSMER